MKTWFDMSIRIWWLLQGIILLVFGFFALSFQNLYLSCILFNKSILIISIVKAFV